MLSIKTFTSLRGVRFMSMNTKESNRKGTYKIVSPSLNNISLVGF